MTKPLANRFADAASAMAGHFAVLLGWRPDEFWAATPAETTAILTALNPPTETGVDRETIARLMENDDGLHR